MVKNILTRSISILAKFPIKLWGISLLSSVITTIITLAGLSVPIITVPIVLTISTGMSVIFLNGYNGETPETPQLFDGFKKENFLRVCGGSCWTKLWQTIWAFVPIAGIVKAYQYAFTPFILMKKPEIGATQAIKESMRLTKGYKGMMFLTDVCVVLAIVLVYIILGALSAIPFLGGLFAIILFLFMLAVGLFYSLFMGLIKAGFYDAAQNPSTVYTRYGAVTPASNAAQGTDWICDTCHAVNGGGTNYCRACGRPNPANAPKIPVTPVTPAADTTTDTAADTSADASAGTSTGDNE